MMNYNVNCCWNDVREYCIGEGCKCYCHKPQTYSRTRNQLLLEAKQTLVNSDLFDTNDFHRKIALRSAIDKILDALLIEEKR